MKPAMRRAEETALILEAEEITDIGQRDIGARQIMLRKLSPGLVDHALEGHAFEPDRGLPERARASSHRRLIRSIANRASGSPSAAKSRPASRNSPGTSSCSTASASAMPVTQNAAFVRRSAFGGDDRMRFTWRLPSISGGRLRQRFGRRRHKSGLPWRGGRPIYHVLRNLTGQGVGEVRHD